MRRAPLGDGRRRGRGGQAVAIRRLALATILFGVIAAPAQARMLGLTGTRSTYRALSPLAPTVHAQFVAFGTDWAPLLDGDHALAAIPLITWEPWHASLRSIAAGGEDAYLTRIAREVAAYPHVVYIRFAHEMNGGWYPWGAQPRDYVAAWRHVWTIFRNAGASNARFLWAPDLIAGLPRARWRREVAEYWPGGRYVNDIGTSLVAFAFQGDWPLSYRFASIDWLARRYRKPFWLAEVKVDAAQRYTWLAQLAGELRSRSWIVAVMWSQTPSKAQQKGEATGDMDWSLLSDPLARRLLAGAVGSGA